MSTYTLSRRIPWLDRWTQPNVEQLIGNLKPHQQRNFTKLIHALNQYPQVEHNLIWFGASWKWTIQFKLAGSIGDEASTICYLVPSVESPVVSIPYTVEFLGDLPIRRLSKFIRDGLKTAKCAVNFHWASWTPGLDNEVMFLIDLFKRKYKFLTESRRD